MGIKKLAVIIYNNYRKKSFKTTYLVEKHKEFKYNQLSKDLYRLEIKGFIKKISVGTWKVKDEQQLLSYFDKTTAQRQKGNRGDVKPPKNSINLFVRHHNISYKTKIINNINQEQLMKEGWYRWESNTTIHYKKKYLLECGIMAKIIYHIGKKSKTMMIHPFDTFVYGNTLESHTTSIIDNAQKIVSELALIYKFQFGLIEITYPNHFAIPNIPIRDNQIQKHIQLNNYFWLDYSKGYAELETSNLKEMKRLVDLPNKVDDILSKFNKFMDEQNYKMDYRNKGDGYQ